MLLGPARGQLLKAGGRGGAGGIQQRHVHLDAQVRITTSYYIILSIYLDTQVRIMMILVPTPKQLQPVSDAVHRGGFWPILTVLYDYTVSPYTIGAAAGLGTSLCSRSRFPQVLSAL